MKRNIKILIIVVVLVILGALIAYQNPASDKDSIKIGSVEGLSGIVAFWGESSKAGMDLAIKDLKAKGIDVEIVYEDSEGKPDVAVTAANKLINIDKVDALFTNFSGPSFAVSPLAKENNIPYVYSAFDPANTETNPYAFKTFFDGVKECKLAAGYAKNVLGLEKIGFIGINFTLVPECVEEMEKVFGKENVVAEIAQNFGETDFRTSLQKLNNAGIKLAISYGYESNYEAIVRQNMELSTGVGMFCVIEDCYTEKIAESVPLSALNGSILFDYHVPAEFTEKVEAEYGDSVNTRSAILSYDALNYMVYGLLDCDKDLECFIENVSNDKSYDPAMTGAGFNGDRIFDLKEKYFMVEDGQMKEIDIYQN